MESIPIVEGTLVSGTPVSPVSALVENRMEEVHALLRQLETATAASQTLPPLFDEAIDDRLVQVRLGVAAGLFAALRCKHAATAGHSLRVAIACSGWAMRLGLSDKERNALEVAALLHDVGVIGAPDRILQKTGSLDDDETAAMARTRSMGTEILRRAGASPEVLEIVANISPRLAPESDQEDDSRPSAGRRPTEWPADGSRRAASADAAVGTVPAAASATASLGARMLAIVEAFDAMTSDRVFRPAWSRERALAELFECAGAQFDRELVERFEEYCREDPALVRDEVAYRWLRILDEAAIQSTWTSSGAGVSLGEPSVDALFQSRLLDSMYDAVVFIDAAGRIALWNRGAERLTGVMGDCVRGELWNPALLGLADEKGNPIAETDCPVFTAIRCGAQSLRRLTLLGRRGLPVAVDSHAIPVIDRRGGAHGAILLFHDASSEQSLEQQCQNLHEKATKDPLTQVANRAEFDRVHAMFVAAHRQRQVPCSLLMLDLDRFKQVNDTYGHQAGDDAIRSIAALLKSACGPGDFVARYGGEEFVMLCADCDNASAARRAEHVRKAFSQIPQPRMNGRTVTVSIGVTEIQPGDTPETMLRRADRALLTAKAAGRNVVVQLGVGTDAAEGRGAFLTRRARSSGPLRLFTQDLVTPVPVKIAAEKLRGFIADHQARVVSVEENRARLEIDDRPSGRLRRLTDRPTTFILDVRLEEEHTGETAERRDELPYVSPTRTRIGVSIGTRAGRNRRRNDAAERARELLISFRSYMMAAECAPRATSSGMIDRVRRMFAPWRAR